MTDAQRVKRKAEETVEKKQTAVTPVPEVDVGGWSGSGVTDTVSAPHWQSKE